MHNRRNLMSNIFKTMSTVLKPETPSLDEIHKIPSYIFLRWLSGSPYTVMAANEVNQFYDIPIECQYNMFKSAFCGKIRYIPYPKSVSSKSQDGIEALMQHFKISEPKAREYAELISDEEYEEIKNFYGNKQ